MSRQARVVFPRVTHHVTQRGNYRQDVFFAAGDRVQYLAWLTEYAKKYGLEVWSYCLMTNHIHLIAFPHHQDSRARTPAAAPARYSQLINRRTREEGYLWQGRFFSCPLDDEYLIRAARYIELNPVRAGLMAKAADWPWSSARAHIGGQVL